MQRVMSAAVLAVGICVTQMVAADASPLPPITGNYEGNYGIIDAFVPSNNNNGFEHGLYLPGFIGDTSWSVSTGTAFYLNGVLDLEGTVTKTVNNVDYSLDFDFQVFETNNAPNGLICGGGNGPGTCKSMKTANGGLGEANLVHFDMGQGISMGTLSGSAGNVLDGLTMDIRMVPLSGPERKPGQLGYGGNWWTDDYGYSNWMEWKIVSNSSNLLFSQDKFQEYRAGDVNFTLVAAPLPAGLPLVMTGLAGLYALRRRKKAA